VGAAQGSTATVGSLDYCLYAWLTEGDDRRFARAFSTYFSSAFPAVLRHLAHLSPWDTAQLEDLAQEALLRFFESVGRARPEAACAVADALRSLEPLPLGPAHKREVLAWIGAASALTEAAAGFKGPLGNGSEDTEWKAAARALTGELALLRARGYGLLHSVRVALRPSTEASCEEVSSFGERSMHALAGTHRGTDLPAADPLVRNLAEQFALELAAGGPHVAALENQCPRVRQFCATVHRVTRLLTRLRAPTNGFLFEVAVNVYLDERKKRRSLKRGGTSGDVYPESATAYRAPLYTLPVSEGGVEETDERGEAAQIARTEVQPEGEDAATDPAQHCTSADFFEKFCAHLRRPLTKAERAYREAVANGRRSGAERHRLVSLTNKFARTMSVLSLLGEGYSQEETAMLLALSRNQVKYIAETTRETYAQFCAAAEPPAAVLAHQGGSYAA
jgi:DNA-directed RNA polymerase specialized sigma24 family protein